MRKPEQLDDVVAQREAGRRVAAVRDEYVLDHAREPEQLLCRCERREHGRPVSAGAVELDDPPYVKRLNALAGEHAQNIAGTSGKLLRRLGVEVHLVRCEVRQ